MRFLSISAVVPSKRLDNAYHVAEVAAANAGRIGDKAMAQLDLMIHTLFEHSGSQDRFVRNDGESAFDLTTRAGKAAIEAAGIGAGDIDLLIYVGVGRGFLEPATSNVFQDSLGLTSATCFDILDACASWLRALHVARSFLETGAYRRIMILNGEFNREFADYRFETVQDLRHKFAQFTVGEAATATIIEAAPDDSEYAASFRTYGNLRNLCMIALPTVTDYNGGKPPYATPLKFFSLSHELFEESIARLVVHYRETPETKGFQPDIVFGHAASDPASMRTAAECGLPADRIYTIHRQFGNVVSASVPLAMARAAQEGRLRHGDRVLVGVASAGVSTAWARFRYLTA